MSGPFDKKLLSYNEAWKKSGRIGWTTEVKLFNKTKQQRPWQHPRTGHPCVTLGISIESMPWEGQTAHHGGNVCVLCSVAPKLKKTYYSYVEIILSDSFWFPLEPK